MNHPFHAYAVRARADDEPVAILAPGACQAIATAMAMYGRHFTSARRIA